MIDCLETLVGITRDECECLPEIPESHQFNITESTSGVYIDELLDIQMSNQGPCGPDDEYVRINRAMESAERQLVTDLVYELTTEKKQDNGRIIPPMSKSLNSWRGMFGDYKQKSTAVSTAEYMGLRLTSKIYRGATVKIIKAYVNNREAGEVTVGIKNSLGEQIKSEAAVTVATAGTWVEIEDWANTTLSLSTTENTGLDYYLYTKGNSTPYRNEMPCTCGSPEWMKYFKRTGFKASDLDEYISDGQGGAMVSTDMMYGLRFEFELDCSIEQSLCQITGDSRDMLARALAYGTCMKVIESVKTDNKSSLWANVQPERLAHMHKQFEEPYLALIQGLSATQNWSPCYSCNLITRRTTLLK